jgi:hypothetical protein
MKNGLLCSSIRGNNQLQKISVFSIKSASWAGIGGKKSQKITEIRKKLQKITKIRRNEPLLNKYDLGYLRV